MLYLARIGRPDILWSVNKFASQNGPEDVRNARIDDFVHSSYMRIQTVLLLWVRVQNNADWDCFKSLILREILKIQNPLV